MKTNVIIDSSVALKWFFPDEEYSSEALVIKRELTVRKIIISVPILFFYEVGNVLKSSVKSARVNFQKAKSIYKDFTDLEFVIYSSKDLFREAFKKSAMLDVTFYDASYVVLAEHLKIPFFTTDDKLFRKAKGKYVHHLKEYTSSLS